MKVIVVQEPGGPEVLGLSDMPEPVPNADQVLIKVMAAGINRPDILQRQGLYPPPADASPLLGLEVAGVITAVGEGVTLWSVGDKVAALTPGGGYAEYALAHEGSCLPVPLGMNFQDAACLPETFMTVWHNVFERAALKSSETLLVHGGSSGIGSTAIQLGKAFGARVFATAGSDAKCAYCEKLGAERAINYQTHSFLEEIKAATEGYGVDVVLDMVGGPYIQDNISLCAPEGRIVNIAFLQGATTSLNLMPVMLKRLTLTGSTLRPRSNEFKAGLAAELKRHVWPLLDNGTLKVHVDKVFAFADVANAHRYMESGEHMGKIVLDVAQEG